MEAGTWEAMRARLEGLQGRVRPLQGVQTALGRPEARPMGRQPAGGQEEAERHHGGAGGQAGGARVRLGCATFRRRIAGGSSQEEGQRPTRICRKAFEEKPRRWHVRELPRGARREDRPRPGRAVVREVRWRRD